MVVNQGMLIALLCCTVVVSTTSTKVVNLLDMAEAAKPESTEDESPEGRAGVRYVLTSFSSKGQGAQPVYQAYASEATSSTPPYGTSPATSVYAAATTAPGSPVTNMTAAMLGRACNVNADCSAIKSSSCISKVCDCGSGFTALSNIACIPTAKAFGDKCVITSQCIGLDPLAACYLDRCMCESIYNVAGQSCPAGGGGGNDYFLPTPGEPSTGLQCLRKALLDKPCCDSRQCFYEVWNSQCQNNVCKCTPDYVNIGTHLCALKATKLGDPCSVNAQCMNLLGAVCDSSGHCNCDSKQSYVSGAILSVMPVMPGLPGAGVDRRKRQTVAPMCMPAVGLNGVCMTHEQCSNRTLNSICMSGMCMCQPGFFPDQSFSLCGPKAIRLAKRNYFFEGSCCGNVTAPRFIGQICPASPPTNIPPPYMFTLNNADFTINADGAIFSLDPVTDTTVFMATISAGGRNDSATVTVVPASCCTQAPALLNETASARSVTINLMTTEGKGVGKKSEGCTTVPPADKEKDSRGFITNQSPATSIFGLFSEPCGETLRFGVTGTPTAGTGADAPTTDSPVTCTFANGFFGIAGDIVPKNKDDSATINCEYMITATGCNGLSTVISYKVAFVCPAPQS